MEIVFFLDSRIFETGGGNWDFYSQNFLSIKTLQWFTV